MTNQNPIYNILGFPGTMVSLSKSGYSKLYPKHVVVFNANVCTEDGKIWYGDVDVTTDAKKLQELAKTLGKRLYVLREMDARFENETAPKLENAVVITDGKTLAVGPKYTEYYHIHRGKMYVKQA